MSKDIEKLFDSKSNDWDEKYNNNGPLVNRLKKLINLVDKYADPKNLLDVGCGSGVFIDYFNNIGVNTVGVDLSKGMIDRCLNKKYINPNKVKFYFGAVENIKFDEKKFDTVICSSVLEYIDNDEFFLNSIYSSMEKGGYLFITVPNKLNKKRIREDLIKKLKFIFYPLSFISRINNYLIYLKVSKNKYLVDEFSELACDIGFDVVRYEGLNPIEKNNELLSSTLIIFVLKKK